MSRQASAGQPIRAHFTDERAFAVLLILSALLMIFLGTYAAALFVTSPFLAAVAALLWCGRAPRFVIAALAANLTTATILVLMIGFRRTVQPAETVTLDIASLALLGNLLLGGPLLALAGGGWLAARYYRRKNFSILLNQLSA